MLATGFLPGLLFVYLALRKSPFLVRWRSAYHMLLRWSRFLVFFLYPAVYRQYFFVSLTLTPTAGALVTHILRLVGAMECTDPPRGGRAPCPTAAPVPLFACSPWSRRGRWWGTRSRSSGTCGT